MENATNHIQLKMNQWKNKLIDLTKSNRLLNFKDSLTTNVKLNQSLNPIFKILEQGSKSILVRENVDLNRYKSKKNQESQSEEDFLNYEYDALEFNNDSERKALNKLETVLNKIRLKAKSHLDERGVNTLFVAFGFLEWTESENSKIILKSPLVLVPVSLVRKTSKEPYYLNRYDDDIVFNPTLAFKMKNDFGIELPENIEEDIESISNWIQSLSSFFSGQKNWRIVEEVYIAPFSFNKLVMYKDFDSYSEVFENNSVVQRLSGIDLSEDRLKSSEGYSLEEYENKSKSVESYQVLDSDSSQLESILAAKNGSSFIMHGPPGTGKSQTIANIIAEILAQGKKVLFVSEKMAALEVVKKRLEKESLGDFCLELHSANTNKKVILEELDRVLQSTKSFSNSQIPFFKLDEVKRELNQYVKELHQTVNPLRLKPYLVHGKLAKLGKVPDVNFKIPNINDYDQELVQKVINLLERFDKQKHLLVIYDNHLWKDSIPKKFTFELQSDIQANFNELAEKVLNLKGCLEKNINFSWKSNIENVIRLNKVHGLLKEKPVFPIQWLENTEMLEEGQKQLSNNQSLFTTYKKQVEIVLSKYRPQALELNVSKIYDCLTTKYENEIEEFMKESFWEHLLSDEPNLLRGIEEIKIIFTKIKDHEQYMQQTMGIQLDNLNLDEVERMLLIYNKLHCFPRPSEVWFDITKKEDVVKWFKEGKSVTSEYLLEEKQILTDYESEILTLDLIGLQERFLLNYSSFLRVFKPAYHRESKLIHHYSKKTNLSYQDILKDLKLANRVKKKQDCLEKEDKNFKEYLGANYQGTETEWNDLELQINNFSDILIDISLDKESFRKFMFKLTERQVEEIQKRYIDLSTLKEQLENCWQEISLYYQLANPFEDKEVNLSNLLNQLSILEEVVLDLKNYKQQIYEQTELQYKPNYNQLLDDLKDIQEINNQREAIEASKQEMQLIYGELFQGYNTRWSDIHHAIEWVQNLKLIMDHDINTSFIELLSKSHSIDKFQENLTILVKQWEEMQRSISFFKTIFPLDKKLFGEYTFLNVHLEILIEQLHVWAENSYHLQEWIQFNEIIDCINELELQDFTETIFQIRDVDYSYKEVFLKRFYKLWLDYAYSQLPNLNRFRRVDHEDSLNLFKELDRNQLSINGSRLYEKLQLTRIGYVEGSLRELSILRREISKKKRHKPIRKLFSEIPDLLMTIKPCMMMSPLSVSQFVDPTILQFDVVIFDEASQIASEDAIGAIVRGKQVIIAGDNKQLPPTRFFGSSTDINDEFLDEEEDQLYDNYESILDECAVFLPDKRLKWHYRSKNESLIAFSNKEIYNNELFTFPSSVNGPNDGVSFVYVKDGVYDRSGSRRNIIEAKKVAELVFELLEKTPNRSLGVIAFSEAQQEAIRYQVEHLRNIRPEFEEFFAEDRQDPFFIKNLENVQGDERDTIIFSVGYGKDQTGNLHYNFGPLNKPGGERRLNVAVTRAKYQVILVSSITHSDLDDSRLKKKGPQLLKNYLYYANTNGKFAVILGSLDDGEFESPLEEDVYEMLTSRGLTLRKQIGCSSYRID